MTLVRMFAVAALLCGLGTGFTVLAQDNGKEKKGPNIQEAPKDAKETEQTKALQDLELASRLIQYGRKNKHAESLLIAAQVLHNTPTQELKVESKASGKPKEKAAPPAKVDNSPKALVAEAKRLSSSPAVASLAEATLKILDEAPRGPVGGPRVDNFTIQPGQRITWDPITFVGLQRATVFIDNRVFGNMLLEVFDQFGNRVAVDGVPGTFFSATWTPAFNGPFTIRLTNRDTIAFRCVLTTN